ncbi:squalene/phytoene synthase family protein [Sphingorhabdus sp. Alg231-15]|uniref:squalene/phytoene synthase family protein n=1 Tax=Sphingorhabdus sp. Alg231-15 TaxID=1922222 RepID=UPI00307B3C98
MNDAVLQLDPLRRLVLAYAKKLDRERYALVFALDSRFAEVIRSTSETLIGQMRLTWWRDNLTKPIVDRPAGEPLVALINSVEEQGADLGPLLDLVEGWAVLLDDFPWDDRQFDQYATKRGESVFRFVLGADRELTEIQRIAAQGWALWDFARHCTDTQMREEAFSRCSSLFDSVSSVRFDRSGRPLSILCKLAQRDVKTGTLTADLYRPKVASMIIWHGVTGC